MTDDQFEIGLSDLKAKFIGLQKAEMAMTQALGAYNEAVGTFLKANGVNPGPNGQLIIPDLIDKVRKRSAIILP